VFFNQENSEMNGDETDVANDGDHAQLKDVVVGGAGCPVGMN
jgi:hypothetical protein